MHSVNEWRRELFRDIVNQQILMDSTAICVASRYTAHLYDMPTIRQIVTTNLPTPAPQIPLFRLYDSPQPTLNLEETSLDSSRLFSNALCLYRATDKAVNKPHRR